MLAWFYLTQAYRYARDWGETSLLLTMKTLPGAPFFLFVCLLGITLGALSLLFGFRTRAGALTLFTITVGATLIMHDYWHIAAPVAREADYDVFARNIAIAGGLLALIGMGGGRFGMDNKKSGKGGGGHKPAGGGGGGHH